MQKLSTTEHKIVRIALGAILAAVTFIVYVRFSMYLTDSQGIFLMLGIFLQAICAAVVILWINSERLYSARSLPGIVYILTGYVSIPIFAVYVVYKIGHFLLDLFIELFIAKH